MQEIKMEYQLLTPIEQESAEQPFWCEPISVVRKEKHLPNDDTPFNCYCLCHCGCGGCTNCSCHF